METKIYLVNVKTTYMKNSYEVDFETWNTYKAFRNHDKAVKYAGMVTEYFIKNKKGNINHDVSIKEVELA